MEIQEPDFFAKYLAYAGGTEVPTIFNRWAAITGLSAWMGQECYFQFGNSRLFPNLYTMLIGESGTKKSTAIKQFVKLMRKAGYDSFSSEKTSKEKFLVDMAEGNFGQTANSLDILDRDLFSSSQGNSDYTPVMIAADEFNDFASANLMDFVSLLGVMWDWDSPAPYKVSTKGSANVLVQNPNITLLSGNTSSTLCRTFPPETIGQGFFSRLIFVHARPNGRRIAFPQEKPPEEADHLVMVLSELKGKLSGRYKVSEKAMSALGSIYASYKGLDDVRFKSYESRRFTHLIKLVQVHAFADDSPTIQFRHVVRANTVLLAAEHSMPEALGHFGMARNSEVIDKVMRILAETRKPMSFHDLCARMHGDVSGITELAQIVHNLSISEKIQTVDDGLLPKNKVFTQDESPFVDWSYLTDEERGMQKMIPGQKHVDSNCSDSECNIPDADVFIHLIDNVFSWGIERNMTSAGGATALAQITKLKEEVGELEEALIGSNAEKIVDGIGDALVVLIQISRLSGYGLYDCLAHSWNEIKDRKGRMIAGIFVKQQDLDLLTSDEQVTLAELEDADAVKLVIGEAKLRRGEK